MGYAVLEQAYSTLTEERQKNVEQFIYFLIDQQEKERGGPAKSARSDSGDFESMLDSFVGCTHAWDGTDVMEYQRKMRGEYRVD